MLTFKAYNNHECIENIEDHMLLFQHQLKSIGKQKTHDEIMQSLSNALKPENKAVLFVAYDTDGMPKGFAFGNKGVGLENNNYFWLNEIHVDVSCRGKGYASALLTWIEQWLIENNINYLATMTGKANSASQRLFKKKGYDLECVFWIDKTLK